MENVYLYSAIVGGLALVVQTVMLFTGFADAELDAEDGEGFDPEQTHGFFKSLSLRTLVAFFTFFGLTGLACGQANLSPLPTLLCAIAAGSVAFFLVVHLMLAMSKLQIEGNQNLANAIGAEAKVYLRIPGQSEGPGKVTIPLQGRTVECRAFTEGEGIETGAPVRVVAVLDNNTVQVLPLEKE